MNYRTAMAGTPNRRFLWTLSRTTQLDDDFYQRLVERATQLGFPVSDLIRTCPLETDDLLHVSQSHRHSHHWRKSRAVAFMLCDSHAISILIRVSQLTTHSESIVGSTKVSSPRAPFTIKIPSYTRAAATDQEGLKGSPRKAASAAFFS